MGSTVGSNSSKQSRQFHTEWIVGRGNWLRYDCERQGMLCVLCQKHDHNGRRRFNQGTWSKEPCRRLRLNSITPYFYNIKRDNTLDFQTYWLLHTVYMDQILPKECFSK